MKKQNQAKKLAAALLLGLGIATTVIAQPAEAASQPTKLKVSSMSIEGVEDAKAKEIKHLIPEINKATINARKLSKQIQLVNDNKIFKVTTEFKDQGDGSYALVVKVNKVKTDNFALTVNNTGNEYTGNWRAGLSYVKSDITGMGDTLGLTYVTSPNKTDDVHQFGLTYKFMLPRLSDTAYISYSYSDVDTGDLTILPGATLKATGENHNFGFHYQHNMKYTKAKKQILDVGVDYKKYHGFKNITAYGMSVPTINDFHETLASVSYINFARFKKQALVYNVGYYQNLSGSEKDYSFYRQGKADKNFKFLRAGANYQYRTGSDWIFSLKANAQYTNDDLIFSEQLGAGGASSIRGFKERVAIGDKGIIGNLEVYAPQLKCLPNQRFLVFLDAGALSNNSYYNYEKNRKLASFGIGYRFFERDGLSVNLDYAKPISDDTIDMGKNYRPWSLNICYRF